MHDAYYRLPEGAQNILVTLYGARLKRLRYNRFFYQRLPFLEKSVHWSSEEMRVYQEDRLRSLIMHAYRTVPYYRRIFDSRGMAPDDIRTLEDLSNLPLLTKKKILDDPKAILSSAPGHKTVRLNTSGSTGTPLTVVTTPYALACKYANDWRQRRWFGVDLGDRSATFNGRLIVDPRKSTDRPFRRNYSARQTLFSLHHLDPVHARRMIEELCAGGYDYLNGYPSTLDYLAKHVLRLEAEPRRIKAIFTSSETLSSMQRARIEQAFHAPVSDRYNTAEIVSGFGQHPDGLYYHNAEDGIVELLPHEGGHMRVVFTEFHNLAMPFIRYDTGDLVEPSDEKAAASLERLAVKQIIGREDDLVVAADGNVVGRLDHIFKGLEHIGRCQIVQAGRYDVTFKIERLEGFRRADEEKLLRNARERLGDMNFRIEEVDAIPPGPNGKFKAVVSRL